MPSGVIFANQANDLTHGSLVIMIRGRFDVDIHDRMPGEFLQDLFEGHDAQSFELFAELHTEVQLLQLGKRVFVDLACAVGNALQGES